MATYGTMNSAGTWKDVPAERLANLFDRILARESWVAPRNNREPLTTIDEIAAYLATGQDLHYDDDWYAVLRQKQTTPRPAAPAPTLILCACGHQVAPVSVMHANLGTSCVDCYDCLSA